MNLIKSTFNIGLLNTQNSGRGGRWRRRRGPSFRPLRGIQLDSFQMTLNACELNLRSKKRTVAILQIEKRPLSAR